MSLLCDYDVLWLYLCVDVHDPLSDWLFGQEESVHYMLIILCHGRWVEGWQGCKETL